MHEPEREEARARARTEDVPDHTGWHAERPSARGTHPAAIDEIEVVIAPDGWAVFSWATPGIQALARLLGEPEFDAPRWCG